MLNFHGKQQGVVYLGIITGEEFAMLYNELAHSADKVPTASHILPATDRAAGMNNNLIQAWIYYEEIEQPKKLKMEL